MILYARQSAWLQTSPERPKNDRSDEPLPSRLEKMREANGGDQSWEPEMPPVSAVHLLDYFFEVGPSMPGADGPSALSWCEIDAWQARIGVELQPWEARLLRRLSREYVMQLRKSTEADCQAPWQPVDQVPDLAGVAAGMRNALASLAKR